MSSEETASEINQLSSDSELTEDGLSSGEVDDLIKGLSFRGSNDTKIDSLLLSRSFTPDIEIFPTSISFPPTFPKVPLSQKITLSNSGKAPETFRLSINGDTNAFRVSEKDIELQQGTTCTFFVLFIPTTVSMYSGTLIIEGRKSIIVPLTAHCINSPLVYPSPKSDVWFFEREWTERELSFTNESISLPLDLHLELNTTLFRLSTNDITIPPKKSVPVTIVFTPTSTMVDIDTSLTISSETSGDNVTIPLTIAPPPSRKNLDFGCAVTGKPIFHEIKTTKPYKVPEVPWPFAFEKEYSDNSLAVFSFCSSKIGTFTASVEMEKDIYNLVATAIKKPFTAEFSDFSETKSFTIQNTTQENVSFSILPLQSCFLLDTTKFELKPRQKIEINTTKVNDKQYGEIQALDMEIKCTLGKKVVNDIITIPIASCSESDDLLATPSTIYNKNNFVKSVTGTVLYEKTEKSIINTNTTILSPMKTPNRSVSGSFYSNADRSRISLSHEAPLRIEDNYVISNESSLKSDTLLAYFPQLSKGKMKSFVLKINHEPSEEDLEIEVPSWIKVDDGEREENCTTFFLTNNYLMTSAIFSQIVVKNSFDILKIPVLAYKGESSFKMSSDIAVNNGQAVLEVRNEGTRSGFIVPSFEEDPGFEVLVSPVAAVVPAGGSASFTLFISKDAPEEFFLRIKVISGDEIIRQLRCAVKPGGYFDTSFSNVESKDEISIFRKSLHLIDPKSTVTLFKRTIRKDFVILTSGDIDKNKISLSTEKVDVTDLAKQKVIITNQSNKEVSFTALPSSSSIIVSPTCGLIKKGGDAKISITMNEHGEGFVEVCCSRETHIIQVTQHKDFYEAPPKSFACGMKVVDFGIIKRNESEQIEVPITNYTKSKIVLQVRTSKEAKMECFNYASNIAIPPLSEEKLFIDFTALSSGLFEEEIELIYKDEKSRLRLYGKGFIEKHANVDFPAVENGGERKAKLKISNKTNDTVRVLAKATKPFVFLESDFMIEPRSFVMCPIAFRPRKVGEYEGSGEIRSESGILTVLSLFGKSYD